jgi:hypothetical protein
LKYGEIHDEAQKVFGSLFVLDYGITERKLKIEISNRQSHDSYNIRNLLGININVMTIADMLANKLCALLNRRNVVNRDIFDCWFFLSRQTAVNQTIIEQRTGKLWSDYLQDCIETIENLPNKSLLDGLGELVNKEYKTFIRNKLRFELVTLLRFYKEFPIIQ